jgi:hypothetical protein
VNYTDPDGREVSFSYEWEKDKDGNYIINEQTGEYNLIGVTMNVTGKVINISSNSKVDMAAATSKISNQIESSFNGKFDVNGKDVAFSTNVNLSVANSMDDVADSDHVFALTDDLQSPQRKTLQGISSDIGGKVEFIDVDYFSGWLDTSIGNVGQGTAAHEFGHLAGLEHTSKLMHKNPGGVIWMSSTKLNSSQLKTIFNSRGSLNKGPNWEYRKIMSPAAGGYIYQKMPYRGLATPFVNY